MDTSINLTEGAGMVLSRLETWNKLQKDTAAYLRLLYMEIVSSLDLIDAVQPTELKGMLPNHPSFRKIIGLLKTEMSEAVFYMDSGEQSCELYERLKKKGKVANLGKRLQQMKNGRETTVTGHFIYENVLQAVSFYVQKTAFLKKMADLSESEITLIHPLLLETRLINIRQRLFMIKSVMEEFPEIHEMAR
jgi:hypothetical protein